MGPETLPSQCRKGDTPNGLGARSSEPLPTGRLFSGTALVHGADGLDEISNTGETQIAEARERIVRAFKVRPEDFGLPRVSIGELQGGDREENAQIIRQILHGETEAKRDIVLMNAAAALLVGGKARDFKEGMVFVTPASEDLPNSYSIEELFSLGERAVVVGLKI